MVTRNDKSHARIIKDFGFYWAEDGTGYFDIRCGSQTAAGKLHTLLKEKFSDSIQLVTAPSIGRADIRVQVQTADHLYMVQEAIEQLEPGRLNIDQVAMVAAGMTLKGKGLADPKRIYNAPGHVDGNRVQESDLTLEQRLILNLTNKKELATEILEQIPWVHTEAHDGTERLLF